MNTKFQASRHLLCFYSPVCVGPGRKPGRTVFMTRLILKMHCIYQGQVLCMSRLEEAVNDADLILECVVEDLEIKKDLLESRSMNTCLL